MNKKRIILLVIITLFIVIIIYLFFGNLEYMNKHSKLILDFNIKVKSPDHAKELVLNNMGDKIRNPNFKVTEYRKYFFIDNPGHVDYGMQDFKLYKDGKLYAEQDYD